MQVQYGLVARTAKANMDIPGVGSFGFNFTATDAGYGLFDSPDLTQSFVVIVCLRMNQRATEIVHHALRVDITSLGDQLIASSPEINLQEGGVSGGLPKIGKDDAFYLFPFDNIAFRTSGEYRAVIRTKPGFTAGVEWQDAHMFVFAAF